MGSIQSKPSELEKASVLTFVWGKLLVQIILRRRLLPRKVNTDARSAAQKELTAAGSDGYKDRQEILHLTGSPAEALSCEVRGVHHATTG